MKRHYSLLLAFLVAVTPIFVSCDENDDFEDLNRCKITVTATKGGKVKISKYFETTEIVLIGSEIEVVATADEGYAFTGWYLGESTEPISTDSVFTFVATKNTTLTAHFTKLSNLTICSAGNGRVSFKDMSGTSRIALNGSEVTVIATPDEDCDFIGWFIGDAETPVSTDAEYTFTVPEEDMTLTAKFSKRPVVTIRSAGNGRVSFKDMSGTSRIALYGSEVTVIATPDEDCDFIGWFIGDAETPVSIDAEYTFVVEENITLTAKFSKRPVVTIRSAGNGRVSFKDSSETSVAVLPGSEVTVIATPDEDCDFIGWFIGDAETPVSTDAEYTFAVMEDLALIAKFAPLPINGHEWVDLGLPSGLKWATCNVGASAPEDYGDYYRWGDTNNRGLCDWDVYKWCNDSYNSMTKYCTNRKYGTVDNKTTLDPEDDAAHVEWGGTWRMPTLDEQKELLNNCTCTKTTQNGVVGYNVTGPNGNSIFLPAAGYGYKWVFNERDSSGYYWSSSLRSSRNDGAYHLYFGSEAVTASSSRCYGMFVRPVSE